MKGKYLRMTKETGLGPYPQVDYSIQHVRGVVRKHSLLVLVIAFALAGLGTAVADPSTTVLAAQSLQGFYVISFSTTGPVPITTDNQLPVGEELVLTAHVQDSLHNPAQSGSVSFQDCSLKGIPAPSHACVSGRGSWTHIITLPVDQNGEARVNFGFVSTPRTIGFRFRYIGQGSGIANGESNPTNPLDPGVNDPGDVTWF